MALPPKAEKFENRLLGPAKKKAEPPSAKTVPEECGCELDGESLSALIRFFELLDKWDREQPKNAQESCGKG